MRVLPFVVMVGIAAFLIYTLRASEHYRRDRIRAIANACGMHYLGEALPNSLTFAGTPFHQVSEVWNVIDGEPRGTRIMAFDCQVGEGKRSWRRTVIAIQAPRADLQDLPLDTGTTIDNSAMWQFLYRPRSSLNLRGLGLTPVEELGKNLKAVLARTANTRPRSGKC